MLLLLAAVLSFQGFVADPKLSILLSCILIYQRDYLCEKRCTSIQVLQKQMSQKCELTHEIAFRLSADRK